MDPRTRYRYEGCLATPPLWTGTAVSPYPQMEFPEPPPPLEDKASFRAHRLGKLVEECLYYALQKNRSVSWICDGLQVQDGKRTVGEIDALFYQQGQPVHLEVAYKFYLYDTRQAYEDPLGHWIGPNRKDRLVLKLGKLHDRQFPLLSSELAGKFLEPYGLAFEQLQQMLCFKGQLFLPFQRTNIEVTPLNRDCIAGFYLTLPELQAFKHCSFYIPQKKDWLVRPHPQVPWLAYPDAKRTLQAEMDKKRSPMAWIKAEDSSISKCFVVFW